MTGPVDTYANAVAAYNRAGQPAKPEPEAQPRVQDDFADLVQGAIRQAVEIGQKSEALSIAAINDRADLGQVVTAVAEAEPVPAASAAPTSGASATLSHELREEIRATVEKVAWEAFGRVTESLVKESVERIEKVAWEVVPQLAETLVQQEIRRLKGDE